MVSLVLLFDTCVICLVVCEELGIGSVFSVMRDIHIAVKPYL